MSARQLTARLPALLAAAARGAAASSTGLCAWRSAEALMMPAVTSLGSLAGFSLRSMHCSPALQEEVAAKQAPSGIQNYEPPRKFRPLADKELWHEAWMYEDKFGTEDDPILVPSLEPERIIGVTDPDDDNLVVWGILKANEPPRQFIEGGEFYVLKVVPYVMKVGDVLEQIEAGGKVSLAK